MLMLTRKRNESIRIGRAVVTVSKISQSSVILGIDAPKEIEIVRSELEEQGERRDVDTLPTA
jgi:carbon storage regulator